MKASPKEVWNWPRVTQLAWQLYSEDRCLLAESATLIKPDGWTIPKEKFFIDNGHSTERCEREGIPLTAALTLLVDGINNADLMVAHNLAFDLPVLQAEMIRTGINAARKPAKFCTMVATTDVCKIPNRRGNDFKWPKLEELHRFLFAYEFDGAHDALADVKALAKCFFALSDADLIQHPLSTI